MGTDSIVLESYNIAWNSLISEIHEILLSDHDYLAMMGRFTNVDPPEGGIFAFCFTYGIDAEFDRLLADLILGCSRRRSLQFMISHILSSFFSKTKIFDVISPFVDCQESLGRQVNEAVMVDCNYEGFSDMGSISSCLARYLYSYGMYEHFYQYHTFDEAVKYARQFLDAIYGGCVNDMFAVHFGGAWSDWFDEHSCSDWNLVLINLSERKIWLLCFSHSD